jgi:hypothetical protein
MCTGKPGCAPTKWVIFEVNDPVEDHSYLQCCGAEAEEPEFNCLLEPEPNLRIPAPAPFYLPKTLRNL